MKITDLNKLSHDLIGICEERGLDIVTSDIRVHRNICDEYCLVADYKDIKGKFIIAPIKFDYKSGKCWITEVCEL